MYDDVQGNLTQLLVQRGYLAAGSVTATPTYYIMVKTTTSWCNEVFYMSHNQNLMVSLACVQPNREGRA